MESIPSVECIANMLVERAEELDCGPILDASTFDLERMAQSIVDRLKNDNSLTAASLVEEEIAMYSEDYTQDNY